jgi:hypothetical protein
MTARYGAAMQEREEPDLNHVREAMRQHDEREELSEEPEAEPSDDDQEDDGA